MLKAKGGDPWVSHIRANKKGGDIFERSRKEAEREVAYMKKTFKIYKGVSFKIAKVDAKTYAMFRKI